MGRLPLVLCLVVMSVLGFVEPAWAKRLALVIGNSNYEHVPSLKNPANDASLMAASLEKVGFEVTLLKDQDQRAMKSALLVFGRKLKKGADAGLIYYAGHGIEVDGRNYLVPVDSNTQSEQEADISNVDLNDLMALMENSGVPFNILVLDACRNNPFRGFRSQRGGLAPVNAPVGTYIAYSTAPGTVAADGDGDNSPFSEALAQQLATPGLTIESVFKNTRTVVRKASDGKQVPFDSSAIEGDFFFTPAPVAESPKPAEPVEASVQPTIVEPPEPVVEPKQPEARATPAVEPPPKTEPAPEEKIAVVVPPPEQPVAVAEPQKPADPPPVITDVPVHECDKLAGYPDDRDLPAETNGVYYTNMLQVDAAEKACTIAVEDFPAERRFKVALGRALEQASRSDEGQKFIREAAAMGSTYAAARVAESYMEDHITGLAELQRLAEAGDPYAMNHLYWCFGVGENGCTANEPEGLKWLQASAKSGNAEGMHHLGEALQWGKHGLAIDEKEALRLYEEAAAKGYAESLQRLGFSYHKGELGLAIDEVKALALFEKAYDKGNAWAASSLGYVYKDGMGATLADAARSVGYFNDAVSRGDEFALFELASARSFGKGISVDPTAARDEFLKAVAAVNDDEFKDILGDMKTSIAPATSKLIQRALRAEGAYGGKFDGVLGASTAKGLQAYREKKRR